jgi:hypothetical protein
VIVGKVTIRKPTIVKVIIGKVTIDLLITGSGQIRPSTNRAPLL